MVNGRQAAAMVALDKAVDVAVEKAQMHGRVDCARLCVCASFSMCVCVCVCVCVHVCNSIFQYIFVTVCVFAPVCVGCNPRFAWTRTKVSGPSPCETRAPVRACLLTTGYRNVNRRHI